MQKEPRSPPVRIFFGPVGAGRDAAVTGGEDGCIFWHRVNYRQKNEKEVFPMARAAARTANVFTRVDPETKQQAEVILNQLGVPMSNAIDMFLKQVVMHRGFPFEVKLSGPAPVAAGSLTKEQFDTQLQKGKDDIAAGRVLSADAVEAEMRSQYGGQP